MAVVLACSVLCAGCPAGQDPRVGYVGTNTCLGCHDGISSPYVQDYRESVHFAEGVGCEDCHGPGAAHVRLAGRGGAFISNPSGGGFANSYASCTPCHEETVAQFLKSGHATTQTATCHDCHTVHRANTWVLPFEDNRICLQCHAAEFPDDAAVTAHTHHPNNPTGGGASVCVACHMQPLQRENQREGHFNHSQIPVEPAVTNAAIAAGITPVPVNACAGVNGCHDGSNPDSPFRDLEDPETNAGTQQLFELWYGADDDVNAARILQLIGGQA